MMSERRVGTGMGTHLTIRALLVTLPEQGRAAALQPLAAIQPLGRCPDRVDGGKD